jgi:hypothetical protein
MTDGHCASSAETLVVTSSSGNFPTSSVAAGKDLVVIQGSVTGNITWTSTSLTIVGQSTGKITAGTSTAPTIHVSGGTIYIRDLTITGGSPGITADSGNILRLDHVSVSNNTAGGILLDGAGFEIKDATVNDNGSNIIDQPFGGIRIQNAPASTTVPKSLALSTITGNGQIGVSCASGTASLLTSIPTSVLVSSNTGGDITTTPCGFTSCSTASTTCGAQP